MRIATSPTLLVLVLSVISGFGSAFGAAESEEDGWVTLFGPGSDFDAFKSPTGAWRVVGDTFLDPNDARRLASENGSGIMVNDPPGRTHNLYSVQRFGDVEAIIEFMVPKRSNSGVKFNGLYEVQIYDSYGVDPINAKGNGGVYPRAELLPTYHHIDKGFPPRANASKAPGEWQRLEVTFRTPRFDSDGEKIRDACFERVVLNGMLIHENLSVPFPTGHAWRTQPEVPRGPLMLQADHGPVAFRLVKVRPLKDAPSE